MATAFEIVKDVYSDKWSKTKFYTSHEAFEAYDKRIDHTLQYKGAHSGKVVWTEWSDAIMTFDLHNEPMSPNTSICKNNNPYGWLCGRAKHMRQTLGPDNTIRIATGGVGGDTDIASVVKGASNANAIQDWSKVVG
ncbi:hypothetical protein F4820DRAFT_444699 [Hypoxylon rubiginosum]|uniref:Uncharacterized protein n=1 Tax=Hypoxylon rubiginosum TaxID=110542 RepID=A0ACB9ZBL9_9PEZI|nr:hypothetical protein F4820DRAFT_444699 [Hypoxylon rubiginosum]